MIRNPILPGFNPDPSLVRAGEDYYVATSTFAWQPGIRLFHSRDLATMVGLACVDAYRKDLLAHFDWFDLRHGLAARMSSPGPRRHVLLLRRSGRRRRRLSPGRRRRRDTDA